MFRPALFVSVRLYSWKAGGQHSEEKLEEMTDFAVQQINENDS
jgi:hypothetical protein